MRSGLIFAAVMAALIFGAAEARADTIIDTSGSWGGDSNNGWEGSGQSMGVGLTDTYLDDVTFYFDTDSDGRTFDLKIFDALNGGSTLFSTSFTASTGATFINIDETLAAGSQIWVQIDYRGFSGRTAHWHRSDMYVGGNSSFGAFGSQTNFPTYDHRFIATFTGSPVPEPGSVALLGLGLVGLGFAHRRRRARAS